MFPQEHQHNYIEFCMGLEGQAPIFYYGKDIPVVTGTILFFPAKSSHCETPYQSDLYYKVLWGVLNPTYFRLFIPQYTGGDNYTIYRAYLILEHK